ncbi:MAG: hypothetical protein QW567_02170 [Candidatus Hadarchaeales archaeon]
MRGVKVALIFIAACLASGILSYLVLSAAYPSGTVVTTTYLATIQGGGQRVMIDNEEYDIIGSEHVPGENGYDYYRLEIARGGLEGAREPGGDYGVKWSPAPEVMDLLVPSEAYETAVSTGGSVTVSGSTLTETRPVDFAPVAAGIGVLVGALAAVFAAWYQRGWGEAAAELMEHGFHDMTIRDVEVVGHMMQLKEFTIPELMKLTRASKITIWRTVQKLMEKGLVRQTDRTRLASGGLGGRGKPSTVYVYTGGRTDVEKS